MKGKLEKQDKQVTKKQIKNVVKVVSPRNKVAQRLPSFRSEKDLIRKSIKIQQKVQNSYEVSEGSTSMILEEVTVRRGVKQQNNPSKEDIKSMNSPKNPSELLSPKAQAARFFRSKNSDAQKSDENIKKILQEREEKLQDLQRKNQELQTRIQILCKQKEKTEEIMQQYKTEKEMMEKNLDKLKNVAQENRKLLKEKAEGFNSSGVQIKILRAQLQELTLIKKSSCLTQIGVNTSIEEEKLSDTAYEEKENISSQMESSNIQLIPGQNELKQPQSQYHPNESNILDGIMLQQHPKFSQATSLLTKIISQQGRTIQQRQKTIYELQQELNELYENKHTYEIMKPNLETSEEILLHVKENQELRECLVAKERKYFMAKEELWAKDREIENLRREIQVKDIFYQAEINSRNKFMQHRIQAPSQEIDTKKQLQMLNKRVQEQQQTIKELTSKTNQQQLIIKSLKDKKTKIIK